MTLDAGTLAGAGMLVYAFNVNGVVIGQSAIGFTAVPSTDTNGAATGNGVAGKRYRFSEFVDFTGLTDVSWLRVYLMTAWSAFTTVSAKTLTWHECGPRPASQSEIATKKASADITGLNATVTQQASAIVTLDGKTEAFLQLETVAGSNGAVVALKADNESSIISMTAKELYIFNQVSGGHTKAVSFVGGAATFGGNIYAGGKIVMGNGNTGWDVAVKAKVFTVTDGTAVSWSDLGYIPSYSISPLGLAPMTTGETPNLYLDNLSSTGAIARLKINVPGTPANYSLTTDAAGGGGGPPRVMSKGGNPDSTNGTYRYQGSFQTQGYAYYTGPGQFEADMSWSFNLWAKVGGTWVVVGNESGNFTYYDTSTGLKTYYGGYDRVITAPAGVTDFGAGGTDLAAVSWTSPGSASGIRTASPAGQTTTLTVTP